MKQNKSHIHLFVAVVVTGLAFGMITLFVNPDTSGATGIALWLFLLGALSYFLTMLVTVKFSPAIESKVLLSFLVSLTVAVTAALSSVQQLSPSDLILILLIDAVVYYAAVRL